MMPYDVIQLKYTFVVAPIIVYEPDPPNRGVCYHLGGKEACLFSCWLTSLVYVLVWWKILMS